MISSNRKTLAIVAAVVVLACVAAVAWARRNSDTAPAVSTLAQPAFGQPAAQPSYNDQVREDGYYSSIRRPIYVHNAMDYQPQQPLVRETQETYIDPRTTVERRNTYVSSAYRREEARHGRSTGKSVAIVAGSAGAGAAIGALAGGGKGAGIGALSGGGAGFIYDRMTHNHVH
jgi:hypothetical protein